MEVLFHPYHLVSSSPWPVVMGFVVLIIVVGVVKMMVLSSYALFFFGLIVSGFVVGMWWRDVVRESTYEGSHVSVVVSGLMVGMVLFIVSELLFFVSFFWTFFHSSLVPVMDLGGIWPPSGVESFNPFQVPLLNTIILLSSGVSVTWAHQCLLVSDSFAAVKSLMVTWLLGVYFLMLQVFEYFSATFSISDSVFGSVFFVATGFHGLHVMIGTVFLIVVWIRTFSLHFSEYHHFGFEASAWYWHFVDVVWLFLFSVVYWWGGCNLGNFYGWLPINRSEIYMIMVFLSVVIVVFLYAVFMYVSMKVDAVENSISPYECGFDPVMGSRVGFSYRFFLISILFLIFDVEISLLLPLPYEEFSMGVGLLIIYFLVLLMVGLVYEYYNGALSWL